MRNISRAIILSWSALVVAVAVGSGFVGVKVGRHYERNRLCCQTPLGRNVRLAFFETFGLATFTSQIGQDKWVTETVFPGVGNGFFLDVGSADGTVNSNTKVLEQKGWTGICIDPFPSNMADRTCRMIKEVVFSRAGERLKFQASGELGGISDTLGVWKSEAQKAPAVEFTTTTLRDVLEKNGAPRFIHFMSLDIEGAELEALKGFPFDAFKLGALAIEHNNEEPKRTEIEALLKLHGYIRVHTWLQDDFYLPQKSR